MKVLHTLRGVLTMGSILLVGVSPATAEELTLKNGQKIVGTIVGYENDMFRVETEFGFALIRKDKVLSVNFETGGSKEAAQKRGEPKNAAASHAEKVPGPGGAEPQAMPGGVSAQSAVSPAPAPQASVSRPLDEPLPPRLQEHVEGNNYVNDTLRFAMFKPPGWKVYEGVPRETGSAIVAVGTEDEQTLLFVDRQVWSGVPDLKKDHTDANLRHTYQDYQKLSETPFQVDGHPAVRRSFKGVIDGAEWHGVSAHVAQGNTVFGIIGLTSAETFEFQQAVFNKIINSFRFLSAKP